MYLQLTGTNATHVVPVLEFISMLWDLLQYADKHWNTGGPLVQNGLKYSETSRYMHSKESAWVPLW